VSLLWVHGMQEALAPQPGPFLFRRVHMIFFTSAECRTKAEQKLSQANRDRRHRRSLTRAAEGWFQVASRLRSLELAMTPPAQTKKAHLSGASGPSMEVDADLFMKIRCFVATVPDALRHLLQLRPRFLLIPALLTPPSASSRMSRHPVS
jgi:hypothetical protein